MIYRVLQKEGHRGYRRNMCDVQTESRVWLEFKVRTGQDFYECVSDSESVLAVRVTRREYYVISFLAFFFFVQTFFSCTVFLAVLE